jgi:transposase
VGFVDIPSLRGGIDYEEMSCPRNDGSSIRTSKTVRSASCWRPAGRSLRSPGELGVHEGTLGNWVNKRKEQQLPGALSETERDELARLRKENAELRMQRDVLKRSVVCWVDEATGRKP